MQRTRVKKVRAVFKAKGNSGKHLCTCPPYGYMKDPEQKAGFLDFCYQYDSNPYVCGMGKDNLFAMGEIDEV